MGLDIYFHKKNTESVNNNEFNEVCYFRKVNFLLPFFNYGENTSDKEISKCEVEELIDACKKVLMKRDKNFSAETLPTTSGFFFGSVIYDEYYYEDVASVLDKMNTLLKEWDDTYKYYMHCWW